MNSYHLHINDNDIQRQVTNFPLPLFSHLFTYNKLVMHKLQKETMTIKFNKVQLKNYAIIAQNYSTNCSHYSTKGGWHCSKITQNKDLWFWQWCSNKVQETTLAKLWTWRYCHIHSSQEVWTTPS